MNLARLFRPEPVPPKVVVSIVNKRNGNALSVTCHRHEIPTHVREFVKGECLPPSEVSLSVLEQ